MADVIRRDYACFIRGPVGVNTYAFGTVDAYRSGMQHQGLLADFPAPTETSSSDFGIQRSASFTMEIADERADDKGNGDDWPITDQNGEFLLQQDGTAQLVQNY